MEGLASQELKLQELNLASPWCSIYAEVIQPLPWLASWHTRAPVYQRTNLRFQRIKSSQH